MMGLQEHDVSKFTGAKTKPVGRFWFFMFQVAEPMQLVMMGGSQMAWIRFMAEMNHRFGHVSILLHGDPERTMTVMSDEDFNRSR